MDKASLSRPQKVKNPPVSNPIPPEIQEELATDTNKYARRIKIGRATIGNEQRVETVGLGNLEVTTTYGKRTDV
jgi:hypothetical protein